MRARTTCTAVLSASLTIATGCPGGGTQNGGDSPTDTAFTDARRNAVVAVVQQVVATATALGTLAPLADPRLSAGGSFGTFGSCPLVTYQQSTGAALSVQLDYGEGCTSAITGSGTVRGQVSVNPYVGDSSWIFFSSLVVNEEPVTGSLDATVTFNDDGSVTIDGSANMNIAQVRDISGPMVLTLYPDGRLLLSGQDVRFDDADSTFFVTFDALEINPFEYDNFVPAAGTVTFGDNVFVPISVMFADRSAREGFVRVIVNVGSPVTFEVPGIL